jgi:CRP-like cAMP-binding protein
MDVSMYDLVVGQIFGLDGLVNLSNIVFLIAFSVRDVLRLRILAVVGEAAIIPYYYLQHQTLWLPIFWSAAFMAVNVIRIVAIILERRPVVLSEREDQLYRIAFNTIEKREFLKMVNLAQWVECSPGDLILEKGQPISDVNVLISGKVEAVLGGETKLAFRPGQLIGDVSAYSGLVSPVDVVARSHGTVVKWDLQRLGEFTANRPLLRAKLLTLVSTDLAAKLHEITLAVSGVAGGMSAARRGSR